MRSFLVFRFQIGDIHEQFNYKNARTFRHGRSIVVARWAILSPSAADARSYLVDRVSTRHTGQAIDHRQQQTR